MTTSREALRRAAEKAAGDIPFCAPGYGALARARVDFIALCDPQTIIGLLDELERLEGNQRTANTIETCGNCAAFLCENDTCPMPRDFTGEDWEHPCPLRSAQQQAQEGT